MQKYIITNPYIKLGSTIPNHVPGAGPYHQFLNQALMPETKFNSSLWRIDRMPTANPPCKMHVHDIDTGTYYLGEAGTFEVAYNIFPPAVKPKPEEEWSASDPTNQYIVDRPAMVYIPAGIWHNSFIVRIDKPPVWEVGFMMIK